MNKHEFKQHQKHGWVSEDTSHIHNVAALKTHFLMSCLCGYKGWVPKSLFAEPPTQAEKKPPVPSCTCNADRSSHV